MRQAFNKGSTGLACLSSRVPQSPGVLFHGMSWDFSFRESWLHP